MTRQSQKATKCSEWHASDHGGSDFEEDLGGAKNILFAWTTAGSHGTLHVVQPCSDTASGTIAVIERIRVAHASRNGFECQACAAATR